MTAELKIYPQRLVNVRVRERKPLEELAESDARDPSGESEFGDAGRVLVRFSGTEPLARVMVEGPEIERVEISRTHRGGDSRRDRGDAAGVGQRARV